MGVYIDENKLVIITGPKTIDINLTNKFDNSIKHEIDLLIRHNELFIGTKNKKRD